MRITLLLALVVFMTSSLVSSECPNEEDELLPCRCSSRGGEIQLWCSHSDLVNVLQAMKVASKLITQPIDEMILENNRLPSLPGQAFGTLKILRLMLRNNNLERVATNWLSGLETSLLELFLVESDLKSIPEDSLLTLPRLEAITILGGAINRVPTMSGLGRVRYIQIQAPIVERIPPSNFFGLPFLEQIHIINSPKLKVLDNDFLHDLPRLTMLNLTNCGINAIQPRALNRLPQLSEIILSYNDFTDATQVGLAIRDLQNLNIVRLDHNRIDRLLEATFVDIPSLKDLYLNDNLIVEVRRGAFHRLPALRSLDLSNNRLRNLDPEPLLPVGSNSVEEVLLAHNEMEHPNQIRSIFSAFPNLRYLDLSYNRFQDIVSGTLRGHHKLEMLHLEHNNLIRVGREVFSNMPSLRELRLANNSLSNFLEFPLWNLPSLKGLDISRNKIQKLDRRILASLPSLRRLDLSGNILNTIDPMTFIGNLALEYVNISFNDIDMIYPHTFTTTQNLYELDVSHNKISQVPVLPKAVEYLYASKNQIDNLPSPSSPDLQLPTLKLLDISDNGIHRIPPASMSGLASLRWLRLGRNNLVHVDSNSFSGLNNLQALDLHNNRILSIHDEALNPLPQLVELSLKGNRLESIPHELLKRNALLKRLDVSRNQMTDINFSALSNNTDLQELYASHNSLSEFPNTLSSLPKLKTLDLGNNRLTQLQSKSIASMPSLTELYLPQNRIKRIAENTFYKLAKLEILDLENNELEDLATHSIKSLPNLLALSFARNKLASIPSSALSNLPSLQSLELQENSLQELASDAFTSCPNLLMVNMSSNQLNALDQCGLHSMRNLEILDLSHNKISTFDTDSMHAMDSLVMLKLDNNKLCNIEGKPFDRMSHLRMVSLRDNKMTTLPELPFVKLRNNIATLDIEGNPLKCSCSILWLQSWLAENREGTNGPRCADGTLLKEFRLSRKNCEETQEREVVPGCDASYRNKVPGTRNKTSNSQQVTSTSPRPLTTKPPSSFSFFGVPIPPISGVSFNNFWGTKNRDQNGRGRKVHGGKFTTPPPERPDPSNDGGFIPMLPGSGGFKPMLSPGLTSQGGGPISYQSLRVERIRI
uniref:Toll-like receptor 13 n=1 Tax=Cacopsylla melanoneura TaxID=428564 RepID=A0A8D8QGL2_9HEMI